MSWIVFSEDYLDYVYIEDFNFDGFMDIGVPIIKASRTDVAMNYYIYDPDEEIFIRVPIADEKGKWEAVVTGYDQNGNKTGKWKFSHDRSSWDDVWKKAEEEMHIY